MKKLKGVGIIALLMTMFGSLTVFAIPIGTAVLGNNAYSLEYVNDPKHFDEIRVLVISTDKIYVKGFDGKWYDNLTNNIVSKTIIPPVKYKELDGKVVYYAKNDGEKTEKFEEDKKEDNKKDDKSNNSSEQKNDNSATSNNSGNTSGNTNNNTNSNNTNNNSGNSTDNNGQNNKDENKPDTKDSNNKTNIIEGKVNDSNINYKIEIKNSYLTVNFNGTTLEDNTITMKILKKSNPEEIAFMEQKNAEDNKCDFKTRLDQGNYYAVANIEGVGEFVSKEFIASDSSNNNSDSEEKVLDLSKLQPTIEVKENIIKIKVSNEMLTGKTITIKILDESNSIKYVGEKHSENGFVEFTTKLDKGKYKLYTNVVNKGKMKQCDFKIPQ